MSQPLVRTKHAGIYKRGSRYVVAYRSGGKQKRETTATLEDARRIKRQREEAADQGQRDPTRETVREYAARWIETYRGNSQRQISAATLADYRRDLDRYVVPHFGDRRLSSLSAGDVEEWYAWLLDERAQKRRHDDENAQRARENVARKAAGQRPLTMLRDNGVLSDVTARRISSVLKAMCTTAVRRDDLTRNPCRGAVLPQRRKVEAAATEDEDGNTRAFTVEQLAVVLRVASPEWRPFLRLLASTGLRVSEAIMLEVADLRLTGSQPHVKVRRSIRRGQIVPPKSVHGERRVPLPFDVVRELREHVGALPAVSAAVEGRWGRLAFPSAAGTPMSDGNLRERVLRPAAEEAGAGWAGFHAFRHTFASMCIEDGKNIVQLSRLLGHHDPAFTLRVYAHLLDDGMGEALNLAGKLAAYEPDPTIDPLEALAA